MYCVSNMSVCKVVTMVVASTAEIFFLHKRSIYIYRIQIVAALDTNRGRLLLISGTRAKCDYVIELLFLVRKSAYKNEIIATVLYWPRCVYSSTARRFHVYKHP